MSFPRYPEYKDSGVDWLGEVPAHWPVVRLRDIAGFAGGATPSRDNPSYWGGDLPWVSPKDMKVESICATEELITEEGLANCAATLQAPGRVLLVVRSGILKHTIPVAINQVPVVLNQDMKSLHFRPGTCESRFFLRWVQGLNDSLLLAWSKQGVTVESIEHAYLASTPLPLPPTTEQQAIVSFLDRETAKIDALIAEQQRLIALLSEKRQAVISHAVTKGLNPDVPMKDSGVEWLGEVPAHWEVRPLKHLVSFKSGGTPSKARHDYWHGDIPWASAKDLKTEILADTADHITEAALLEGAAELVPADSVLVVVRGMILARTFPVTVASISMAINQDLKALIATEELNPAFLAWLLRGSSQETLTRLDEAGHGTKALRMDAWGGMMLPVPPVAEQEAAVAYIEAVTVELDGLRKAAERAIELLQERRTALISAAVTGKIDVRDLARTKTTSPETRHVEPA